MSHYYCAALSPVTYRNASTAIMTGTVSPEPGQDSHVGPIAVPSRPRLPAEPHHCPVLWPQDFQASRPAPDPVKAPSLQSTSALTPGCTLA